MTKFEKTIEKLGLSATDARNAILLTYKKQTYTFYTDGAGLDYFDFNKNQEAGHELFCKMVDNYRSLGLINAAIKAGATITPEIKRSGYNLYRIQGVWELWKGAIEHAYAYRAGYVSNPENFDMAVDAAEEEIRCLMAEAN